VKRIIKRNIILSKINNYLYDSLLPINLTYLYNMGSILGLVLVTQILTGFMLACNYIAETTKAFESVEYIMREVPYGYVIRYMHANGAGIMFAIMYIHIARALIYGSYTKHRIGV
jgi:ubiquinol-cytochrome c reductase cytochrome b subunit